MLKLKHLTPLFTGGNRFCFIYPGDPDKCIKVLQPGRTGAARKKIEPTLKRFRHPDSFDDQLKEIEAYTTLIKQQNPRIWNHIPELFGTEETDYGLGIITRLYRNHDGTYPKNLQQIIPDGISPELAAGIEEFKIWLEKETVVTRDLHTHNVIAVSHKDGRQQVLVVDGIGNAEHFPLSTWFKFFARRKVQRKLKNFDHRIAILLPKE